MSKIIMFTGNIAARKFSHENLVGRALVCLFFNFTVKIVNSLIFTSIFYMVPKKWGGGNFMIIQFCICKFKKKMFAVRKGPPLHPILRDCPFGSKFKSSHAVSWLSWFRLLGILGEVATGRISASTASGNISVETFDWLKSLNLNNKE